MSVPSKTRRKRAEREPPGVRRNMILLAARRCLSKNGMRGFTLKNIAAEAEVSISLVSHYFGSADELLKAVFKSVMVEIKPPSHERPGNLHEALANLRDIVRRNFDPEYYSPQNLLVWLPIYEEMLLNARTRRSLARLEDKMTAEIALAIADIARLRRLRLDPEAIGYEFLAFLDGLWLRWCLSGRRDTGRELDAAIRFLESRLGPLEWA